MSGFAALALEQVGPTRFIGQSQDEGSSVVFGGQLMAQVVIATTRCVPGKEALAMHSVFTRGASPDIPIEFEAEVVQDGRTAATVVVTAAQDGRRCVQATVLMHAADADLIRHADPMPASSPPAMADDDWWQLRIEGDVDVRDPDAVGPPDLQVWSRFPDAPDDGVSVDQALLAWASDGFLIGAAMRPHAGVGQALAHRSVSTTVLSHTLSFHERFRARDWLLLDQHSTYAGRGRVHGRGEVFDSAGRLVASFSQDAMVRDFAPDQRPPAGERARY